MYESVEIFKQEGYETNIQYDGIVETVITRACNGTSLRKLNTRYKQMVSTSTESKIKIDDMYSVLKTIEADGCYVEKKELSFTNDTIFPADLQTLYKSVKAIMQGLNLKIQLSHAKYAVEISTLQNNLFKKHEHALLIINDITNKNGSNYLVDVNFNKSYEDIMVDVCNVASLLNNAKKIDKPLPTGKYPVIFAKGTGGVLFHEVIGHQFEISKPYSMYSPLTLGMNNELCAESVTITDADFCLTNLECLDDEGTVKNDINLIEKGRISSLLTDKFHAEKQGNYGLTGNGRRASYLNYPESRMYRTYVRNGKNTLTEALNCIEYGLYIEGISNAHCNHRTGEIFLHINHAKIINKGLRKNPFFK